MGAVHRLAGVPLVPTLHHHDSRAFALDPGHSSLEEPLSPQTAASSSGKGLANPWRARPQCW